MRSKLILVIVGLCVLYLNNVSAATTDNKTKIIEKINQAFPQYLKSIITDRMISGFKSTDLFEDATLSEPFQIYAFDTTGMNEFKSTKDIKALTRNRYGEVWYSIFYFKNEPRGLFTIFKVKGGQYKTGSCNPDERAPILDELFKTYSINDVIIFQEPGQYDFYYHLKKHDLNNLTKISSKLISEKIIIRNSEKNQSKKTIDFGPISDGIKIIETIEY